MHSGIQDPSVSNFAVVQSGRELFDVKIKTKGVLIWALDQKLVYRLALLWSFDVNKMSVMEQAALLETALSLPRTRFCCIQLISIRFWPAWQTGSFPQGKVKFSAKCEYQFLENQTEIKIKVTWSPGDYLFARLLGFRSAKSIANQIEDQMLILNAVRLVRLLAAILQRLPYRFQSSNSQ